MTAYPTRERYFSHRFVRVLHKSCAAQDIGPAACFLLCIIAHTEDAGRYAGPARFWNTQLMETLGFRSPKQLDAARNRAIEAGWLIYERGGTRAVGEYFVAIPERFSGLNDAPIEGPADSSILSAGGMNPGKNNGKNQAGFFPNSEREGEGKRNEKVKESGKPPIPIPDPFPNTNTHGEPCDSATTATAKEKQNRHAYSPDFGRWYALYPLKSGKVRAAAAFDRALKRIMAERQFPRDQALEWLCAKTADYARSDKGSGKYAGYPEGWLSGGHYDDDPATWADGAKPAPRPQQPRKYLA